MFTSLISFSQEKKIGQTTKQEKEVNKLEKRISDSSKADGIRNIIVGKVTKSEMAMWKPKTPLKITLMLRKSSIIIN
jgi:hypothetical protein